MVIFLWIDEFVVGSTYPSNVENDCEDGGDKRYDGVGIDLVGLRHPKMYRMFMDTEKTDIYVIHINTNKILRCVNVGIL